MRIAHLLPTLEIGGRERTAIELARAGRAFGIEPLLVTHDAPAPARALLDAGDLPVIGIERLADHAIDLVHAHGHVTAIAAARSGLPAVATLHVTLGGGWRWAWPIRRALREMRALTAVSTDLARSFARLSGRDVAVIPTGIDLAPFRAIGPRPGGGPLVIGVAARLHPIKRHRDIFAAVRTLRGGGLPVELLVGGDGPLAGALAAEAGEGVTLLGAVADMPRFWARCDLGLLASDHEGAPLALIEAMAAGRPCVATAVGGVPAMAAGGGIRLAPPRTPAALAHAIASFADPARRAPLAAAARANAAGYAIEARARAYARLYRRALAPSAPIIGPFRSLASGAARR